MLPLAAIHAAPTNVESEPAAATLEVRTIHEAQVDIDGATYDGDPVEVEVPAGEHRIEVTAPGYHPWRATVKLGSGSHVTMTTDLLSMDSTLLPSVSPDTIRLATSGASVFMTTRASADASSLLPSPTRTKSDVFLATPASLPLSAEPRADGLLTARTQADPDVFMVEPVQTSANPFLSPRRARALPSVFLPSPVTRTSGLTVPMATPVALLPVERSEAEAAALMPAKRSEADAAALMPAVRSEAEAAALMPAKRAEAETPRLLPTAAPGEADVLMPTP